MRAEWLLLALTLAPTATAQSATPQPKPAVPMPLERKIALMIRTEFGTEFRARAFCEWRRDSGAGFGR
jgi:hypothetical protein